MLHISGMTKRVVEAAGTAALVLLLALVLVAGMYMALPSPAIALGTVTPLDAWPATPQMTATTGDLNGTFTVSDGINRLVVVLVCSRDSGGSSGQTFTATYGGKVLTQAWLQNSSDYQTWVGYLKEADIGGRSGDTVAVAITGTHTGTVAYVASYSGVDQTAPVKDAGGTNINLGIIMPIGGPLDVNGGGYGLYGWSSVGSRTQNGDSDTYTVSSNVSNPASFSYGVASKAFGSTGTTNPWVTWTGATGKVAVSFITLNPDASYPVPVTTGISPASKTVGDASFTLTVNGSNFVNGVSVVRLDGADRLPTTFVSSTQLTAVIPASDLAAIGDRSITVFTPAPGGGTSAAQTLRVRLTPSITWPNPATIVYGTALTSTQLNATASVPGTFAYSPDLGALLPAGNSQALQVVFTPLDTANYNTVTADAYIDVTARTVTVTADARSKVYGAADPALTYTSSGALVSGDSFSGALARGAGETVGSYPITRGTLSLSSNYTLSYVGASLTISPKALTITANDQSKDYGTAANLVGIEFTTDGLVEGDAVVSVALTSTGAAADATIEGSPYPILAGGAVGTRLENYQIIYVNGSLTVTRASAGLVLTSSVVESAPGRPLTFTVTIAGTGATGTVTFMDGETVLGSSALTQGTATFDTSTLGAGAHSIRAVYSGDANYAGSTSQPLDIKIGVLAPAGRSWALIGGLLAAGLVLCLLLLLLILRRRRQKKPDETASAAAAASAIASQVALTTAEETGTYAIQLERELESAIQRVEKSMEAGIQAVCRTVETKDPYVAAHQQRVSQLACTIAKEMGLPDWQIDGIRVAGLLHDIGKITVPTEILSKPGKLSALEMAMIKDHPKVAFDILKNIEFDWPIARIVAQHHERLDGSGYPYGLSGNDILLEARILAVADVVEAMSSSRPYRPALGAEKALAELARGNGTIYDPDVVRACEKVINERGFKVELNNSAG